MKKYLVTLLIIITSLCILACGGDSKKSSTNNPSQKTTVKESKIKNQDLSKIIPIAKIIMANESELREVEKILSSLEIDFNNIENIVGMDYPIVSQQDLEKLFKENAKFIKFTYQPKKGESFSPGSVVSSKKCYLRFAGKNLIWVVLDNVANDEVYLYARGIIYHKISDFIITDKITDKIIKNAMQQIQNSEYGKKYSDIKLAKAYLEAAPFAKSHGQGDGIFRDKYLHRIDTFSWYKNLKSVPYIQARVNTKAKEKYYGGEKNIDIEYSGLYDTEGNFVTSEKFNWEKFKFVNKSYITADTDSGGTIDLGQVIDVNNDPDASVEITQNQNQTQTQANSSSNVSNGQTVNQNSSQKPVNDNSNKPAPSSILPISANAIASVKHSSVSNEDGNNHSGTLTTDGDTKTCWVEGVPGLGIGENITYYFNGNYKVSGINIWTGHQKSEDLFFKNARPTAIRVIGSDGSNVIYPLNDAMGMQRVTFNNPITVNNIKLVIEKVAPGNKYEDTCIAEVNFF